ncbi:hypothetical protein PAMP_005518 [Pampus punctatissimus]
MYLSSSNQAKVGAGGFLELAVQEPSAAPPRLLCSIRASSPREMTRGKFLNILERPKNPEMEQTAHSPQLWSALKPLDAPPPPPPPHRSIDAFFFHPN